MLTQQLPLHKKMLSMLKSKEASASEQSKKMKEILSTQTRIMELKKEIKAIVEEVEKLREEEKGHVFVPIEKRPVFVEPVVVAGGCASVGVGTKKVGGGAAAIAAGKRSLDRRTTVLRVEGFGGGGDGENSKEDVTEVSGSFPLVVLQCFRDRAHIMCFISPFIVGCNQGPLLNIWYGLKCNFNYERGRRYQFICIGKVCQSY
jgi:hypothetical protein